MLSHYVKDVKLCSTIGRRFEFSPAQRPLIFLARSHNPVLATCLRYFNFLIDSSSTLT